LGNLLWGLPGKIVEELENHRILGVPW
jgi:hypothetical protein